MTAVQVLLIGGDCCRYCMWLVEICQEGRRHCPPLSHRQQLCFTLLMFQLFFYLAVNSHFHIMMTIQQTITDQQSWICIVPHFWHVHSTNIRLLTGQERQCYKLFAVLLLLVDKMLTTDLCTLHVCLKQILHITFFTLMYIFYCGQFLKLGALIYAHFEGLQSWMKTSQ